MKLSLPQLLWYGNGTLEIELPETWQVECCPMRGAARPPLTLAQIEEAIRKPIGTAGLKELARGKKRAVLLFDDMTRPTRTHEIAPILVRELTAGGIREEDITFVCALGTHGALTMNEFRKKLGPGIVERFRVFNHNIYENCVDVGTTPRGTRMRVNREYMEADLKVAVGCVTAHAQVGFSGGGKIILPGVSHVDSIAHYHIDVEAMGKETTGLGNFDRNILRFEIEEAARMAGIDFLVNVTVNGRGATSALFAGDWREVHEAAVRLAKELYAADPRPMDKDLVIANAFVKANEMGIAVLLGVLALKDFAGTVVVIADSPEGQVVHYLLGRFGTSYGGRQYPIAAIPPSIRLIVMAPHLDRNSGDWFSNPEVITWTRDWAQTLEVLRQTVKPDARVAVVPNATMQYYAS
ncbi:MAG: lactate racemase domain-containing protein [bacterium]